MFLCRRYFGFPRAEEDGEVRACSLALALVADAAQMRQERGAAALTVSVGIHAAVVVVGRLDGGGRPVAQGEAPSIARQLQAAAAADEVLVSQVVRDKAAGPSGRNYVPGLPHEQLS